MGLLRSRSPAEHIWSIATIREFLRLEATAGSFLIVAAALALAWANSPAGDRYIALIETPVAIHIGNLSLGQSLLHWINGGLMAVFFLLVGLELKREILEGELSSWKRAALPAIAAVGGIVVPAMVYSLINGENAIRSRGWAIPTATDIAFALGVLSLLGGRVPTALKVALLALAAIDDLGAILIIAAFYTSELSLVALVLAAMGLVVLALLNWRRVSSIAPYTWVTFFLWGSLLESGVHATLAGVAMAIAIPMRLPDGKAPVCYLEHILHPWVSYGILPVFAFANAGVALHGLSLGELLNPVLIGIVLGLFVGKQLGVMIVVWVAIRVGICNLPGGVTWMQFYGMAVLTGIGFTMSLFIGTLAFEESVYSASVRLGVIGGSFLSAIVGVAILYVQGMSNKAGGAVTDIDVD
jgi:NhaA family Na+:H+ antiporter